MTKSPGRTAVAGLSPRFVELPGAESVIDLCVGIVMLLVGPYVVVPKATATAEPLRWEDATTSWATEEALRRCLGTNLDVTAFACSFPISRSPSILDKPNVVVIAVILLWLKLS
jgi:hypothetical protein